MGNEPKTSLSLKWGHDIQIIRADPISDLDFWNIFKAFNCHKIFLRMWNIFRTSLKCHLSASGKQSEERQSEHSTKVEFQHRKSRSGSSSYLLYRLYRYSEIKITGNIAWLNIHRILHFWITRLGCVWGCALAQSNGSIYVTGVGIRKESVIADDS